MKKKVIFTAALALTLSAGAFAACDPASSASGVPDGLSGSLVDSDLSQTVTEGQTGYRLSFDSCGGSPVDAVSYPSYAYLVEPEAPMREGYRFDGWYWDQEYTREFVFATNTMPAADVTVYAKWTKLYTVTFDSRGGSHVNDVTGEAGEALAAPEAPIRANYVFDGWFTDTEGTTPCVFDTIPAEDITVYAHWHERQTNISVTLMPNLPVTATVSPVTATANEGESLDVSADETFTAALTSALGAPVYTFGYWAYDAAGRQPVGETMGYAEGGSVTLYAHWIRSAAYVSLTFVNGDETLTLYAEKQGALSSSQTAQVNRFYGGTAPSLITGSGESYRLSDRTETDLILTPESALDDFTFTSDSRYCYLERYSGRDANVVIPSTYRNLPVIGIAEDAFAGNSAVETVYIPAGVGSIGAGAFSGCTSLTAITGASGVSSIGEDAFADCGALETYEQNGFVYLNDTCRTLLSYAGRSGSITVPANVIALADGVFRGSSVRSIAFAAGCSIERIPANAFAGCTSLTSIDFSVLPVRSVGERAFEGCTSLTSASLSSLTAVLGAHAFKDCTALTSVQMDGVLEMGEGVFENCGLTSVDLRDVAPSGYFVQQTFALPADAFRGCTSLVSVLLPQSLSSIGANAFSGCTALETVTVNADAESSLTEIAPDAFTGCTSLRTVILFARTSGGDAVSVSAETFADCAEDLVVFVASGSPAYDRNSSYYQSESDRMMSYTEIYAQLLAGVDVRAAEAELPVISVPSYTWLLHDDALSAEGTDVADLLIGLGLTVSDNATPSEEITVTVDAVYRTDVLTESGENTLLAPEDETAGIYDLSETGRYLVYVRATDRFGNSYVDQVTLVVID